MIAPKHARTGTLAPALALAAALASTEGEASAQAPATMGPRAAPSSSAPRAPQAPQNEAPRHPWQLETIDAIDLGLLAVDGVVLGIASAANPNPTPIIRADRSGKAYANPDTVPAATVMVGAVVFGAMLTLSAAEANGGVQGPGWDRRTYNTFVGLADTMLMTLAATESLKKIVGRPRPDYDDRVELGLPQRELRDGRMSFPSGHTASSFAFANYAALAIGGSYVWGDTRTPTSRIAGIGVQAALLATAGYVSMSRFYDERHNPSDIWAGALLGLTLSHVAYWRRFDRNGRPRSWYEKVATKRPAPASIDVVPVPGGLGLSGTF